MKYFDRICIVEVSPDMRIQDLRIKFDVKKSIFSNLNYCRVDISNLSQTTRNKITSDPSSLVRVKAGYVQNGGAINIGQGNISNVIHSLQNPDIISTIYSKDGFNSIIDNNISLSFKANTSLKSVIDAIAKDLKLPIKYAEYNQNATFKNGYSYLGSIPDALDQLGEQFRFKWSIQNGELMIIQNGGSNKNKSISLSANTGLIESPELIIKTKNLDLLNKNEYKITALLQPQLEAGDLIEVKSKVLNGTFIVKELNHLGDTRGNEWYTKIIVTNS
jgi:hypothetical protein